MIERWRLTVKGIVQGVGFRPFVFGLAQRLGLAGHVGNHSGGVFIEIEGAPESIVAFRAALLHEAPPLAHVESVTAMRLDPRDEHGFAIVESEAQPIAATLISPDLAICDDCLRELFDPADRRYRYPFINCTNCGPRFTIIQDIPYDRATTTMSGFELCPDCKREYHDPVNRRFHAQPNACPVCGPRVWLRGKEGQEVHGDAAFFAAQQALRQGRIVAVKGLGGFHLACDAARDDVLQTLRQRKGRVDKPFAVMVRDLDVARQIAQVDEQEAGLLTSRERPILLLRKRPGSALSDLVSPGNAYVGVMLPYSPLHYLLIDDRPLVMTSGNFGGEPIVKDNHTALERLAPLADSFLLHNRPIRQHCDDSVLRIFRGRELPIRRSRGYTPYPVHLPFEAVPVLAAGGELKNTFCLTRDEYAILGQHIGDMENPDTLDVFDHAAAHFLHVFRITPRAVIGDKHPGYLATQWAARYSTQRNLPLISVQHHHAHIVSVMAEHGIATAERVIGVAFDGTGYGDDRAIWGGEFLIAGYTGYRRAAHLRYALLPGGDAGVKRPYRMALGQLHAAGIAWDDDLPPVAACSPAERGVLSRQFEIRVNVVPTSSMGRLFDSVAALIGIRQAVNYEAQAAIELEGVADESETDSYAFALNAGSTGPHEIDPGPLLGEIIADLRAGVAVSRIAAKFHNAVAAMIGEVCLRLREESGLNQVALSGGVFQNVLLLARTVDHLQAHGFEVLTHRAAPPNDGGLALGQAAIGSLLLQANQLSPTLF